MPPHASHDTIGAILSIHAMVSGFLIETVEDIPEHLMTEQPCGLVNHPAWTLSHLWLSSAFVPLIRMAILAGFTFTLLIGGHMALNNGPHDVGDNVGPAVCAKAMTMGGGLAVSPGV